MIDPALAIPEDILRELRQQRARRVGTEALIDYLAQQNLSAGRAKLALACAGVMTLGEAKSAVHLSNAYAEGRDAREHFEQSAFDAFHTLTEGFKKHAA